ncbi:hypothetical protein EWM64_g1052 [Hericium alpestre]|uniref:Uncharacterized protein n=1 Tax=Hericium alpestre TaxID=135208 RepID=A0A4Z0A7A2_9AGAM|nr:hypothetical protein EWM64_g1052 [Hericium alpestre]
MPRDIDSRSAGDRRTIRAIPTEVLCQIFRAAKDIQRFTKLDDVNGRYPSFDQITISHVCRQWRDNALGLPELWTSLLIIRDSYKWDHIDMFLQRSQSQPLDIIIRWCPRRYEDEVTGANFAVPILSVLSMLSLHSHRWRSFDLIGDTGNAVNFTLAVLRPLRVPLLRRLSLKYITPPNEGRSAPWQIMSPIAPFEVFGAQLEELSIAEAFVDWGNPVFTGPNSTGLDFTGLRSLILCNGFIPVGPTMPQLFSILSRCPNLTMLHCGAFPDESPIQLFDVKLSALQSLELMWYNNEHVAALLHHLSAPKLRSFSLKCALSLAGSVLNALMERPPLLEWAPTPLPDTLSFLQRLRALRTRTPMAFLPAQWRHGFYERLQDIHVLILENMSAQNDKDLPTALVDLVSGTPANHGSASTTPAVLLPHLTTLVLMSPQSGLLRPFVEGRRDAGVPLKRLFANFASDHPALEVEWLRQNLEVVGTVRQFLENGDGNVETWLALDTEPVDTARFVELCAEVGCVVYPRPA